MQLQEVDPYKFPVIKILKKLNDKDSLFDTVIVSANDALVNRFLMNQIKFIDISKSLLIITNLNEFKKFKKIEPINVEVITKLAHYVRLKINSMSI